MGREFDKFMHVRVADDQKRAVEAVAKARRQTAGELVREALDAHVLKGAVPMLTAGEEDAVVKGAAPVVDEALAAVEEQISELAGPIKALAARLDAIEAAGVR
jgi:hypothetical protein